MSVSDVFITDLEASDLKPATLEGMLHHPFQEKRSLAGSNRMEIRYVPFINPDFGQRNEVQIPAMDLIPHEMFVEFRLSLTLDDAPNTLPKLMPTPTWLTLQGADLNYKEVSVYNMSEPEALINTILDQRDNVFQSRQRLMAMDNRELTANSSSTNLYLPLDPLCTQVLSKVGPLSSYASNDWSVSIDLRPLRNLIQNTEALANVQPLGNAYTVSANLVIIGSLAPAGEVAMARDALAQNGIVWNFLRSYHIRNLMSDNAGSSAIYSQVYSSIVGAVSEARLLIRNKATWDTNNNQLVNTVNYQSYYGVNDTINVGKTSNPYEVFGQNLSLPIVYSLFSANGTKGSGRYVELAYVSATSITPNGVDTGLVQVEFAESPTDNEFGTSTGSYPVKNDLQIDLNISTDTVQDNYIDSIIYVHVRGVITSGTANINLSA